MVKLTHSKPLAAFSCTHTTRRVLSPLSAHFLAFNPTRGGGPPLSFFHTRHNERRPSSHLHSLLSLNSIARWRGTKGVFWPPQVSFPVHHKLNIDFFISLWSYLPPPLPCSECKTEGAICLPGPLSLASNANRRGCFQSWPATSHPFPLPCFKCERHITTHSPSLASNVSWRVVYSLNPPRHQSPSIASCHESHITTHSPSLTSNVSQRVIYSLDPPHHQSPSLVSRFKSKSEGVF